MTEITDLDPVDSGNTAISGESLDGSIANMGRMDNTLQAILGMFGRWTSSDTIASAGTTDIGAQAEAYLTVSGTTTITSFGTVRAGTIRFLKFSGILTLTQNATSLILPAAANITTAAGDTAVFVSEGSGNWRCLSYNKASQSVVAPSAGNCRLTLSGGNLSLGRINGRLLTINGVNETIPSTAPTLAATGLTPSTLYYIYAYMNSGVMTLEASATAYAVDATTGVYIKTGDATRSLVGMARPITGPAWANTSQNRFVRSWYNEPAVNLSGRFTANRQRTSTAWGELNSEIRCEFIAWSGETMQAMGAGNAINGLAGDGSRSALGFDSTTVPEPNGAISLMGSADIVPFSVLSYQPGLTEGYHYVTLLGAIQTGASTSTWYGDTDGRRAAIVGSLTR
jgi:hypothetical protein